MINNLDFNMIQAKDLRIGNLVLSNNPLHRKDWLGKVLSILEIKDESVSVVAVDELPYAFTGGQFLKYIDPIPLTEEILLKCGFNWSDGNKTHIEINMGEGRNLTFYFKDDKINETQLYDQMNQVYNGMYFFKPLLYLHQLQNLYWCLTSTELEINL